MPDADGELYIGLMSGTSMDGVDAAAVRFHDKSCGIAAKLQFSYPQDLRAELIKYSRRPDECSVDVLGRLDSHVGAAFADAASSLINQAALDRSQIKAIGSHGQTLRHQPDADPPFTVQIGDPNVIAAATGITTIGDFRRRDVAEGGQGAPLTPAFHQWLFADPAAARVVLNIGGIANVSCLQRDGTVVGFDTGPGNTLLDAWNAKHKGSAFDSSGRWSSRGTEQTALLDSLRRDAYFSATPPKSTGFDHFNLDWVAASGMLDDIDAADVQATLCELTATTIAEAIKDYAADAKEILVCGGGVHNADLMSRLARLCASVSLKSTADYGLDPDWVEAAAFAWLAMRTLQGLSGNLPAVTGAAQEAVLGGIYQP